MMRERLWMAAGALALAFGGCGGGGGGDDGLSKPAGDFVAFLADGTVATKVELFVSDAAGADVRSVSGPSAVTAGDVLSYQWSPDRTRLAFIQDKDGNGTLELYVVNPAGGLPLPILDLGGFLGSSILDFAWSPNSAYLAVRFIPVFLASTQLTVYPADGSFGAATLSGAIVAGGDVQPGYLWSPDSTRVAFRGDLNTNEKFDLFTNLVNGSDRRLIDAFGFNTAADVQPGFAWSFDGSRIAFLADLSIVGRMDLYTNVPNGTSQTMESTPIDATRQVLSLQWSPTAMVLAYEHDAAADDVVDLWSVASPGGTPVNLTEFAGSFDVGSYAWAPNGSRVAVLDDYLFGLSTHLPAGGTGSLLESGVARFVWSPNSAKIAFVRDDVLGAASFQTLVAVGPTGASPVEVSDSQVDGATVARVTWSPDSSLLAWAGDSDGDLGYDLLVSDTSGGTPVVVYDAATLFLGIEFEAFSANSQALCFAGGFPTVTGVMTSLVDGSDLVDLSLTLQGNTDCSNVSMK